MEFKAGRPKTPLSDVLPPLICGTATFNSQYNPDPYALPTTSIVHQALSTGVRAFDTSPYYGPAEELLGQALYTPFVRENFPRESFYLLTKVGRIASSSFDYSPAWVQASVQRSLRRLHTNYLDVVYCHDVEFVSPEEVLIAVRALREIRDTTSTIRYVGISGYPVQVLCSLAEMILEETGEPLDAVMSYANFTLQNSRLLTEGIPRLRAAGVDVVPNASPLGMGLLRRDGVPIGNMGNWHPAPDGLRAAVHKASEYADSQGERLEVLAIRFALETWLSEGKAVGGKGVPLDCEERTYVDGPVSCGYEDADKKLGVSVMGVSNLTELHETIRVWRSILDGHVEWKRTDDGTITPSEALTDREWSLQRQQQVRRLAQTIQGSFGTWADYAWASPGEDFVNAPLKAADVKVTRASDVDADMDGALPSPPSELAEV